MFLGGGGLAAAPFQNGGFESPGLTEPATEQDLDASPAFVSGWSVETAGGLFYERNGNPRGSSALEGDYFAGFGHNGSTGGQISQTLDTVPGMTYEVTYWITQIQGANATDQAMTVEAFDGAASLADAVANFIPPNENQWAQGTPYRFTAASSSTRLVFTDTTATAATVENWALDGVVVSGLGAGRIVYQQFTNAFVNDLDGRGVELVLMNADGSGRQVITGSEFFNYGYAALTSDGSRVAFVAEQGLGGPKLWVMKAEPHDPQDNLAVMVRGNVSAQSRVCWSPDGRRIAFADAFDPQIYVLNAVDGGGDVTPESGDNLAVQVTSLSAQAQNPAWSPDGRVLAYSDGETIRGLVVQDGAGALTPEDMETNAPVALTGGIYIGNDFPAWSPDGTQIILSTLHPAPPGIPYTSDVSFRTVREPLAEGGAFIPAYPVGFNDGRVSLFRDQSGGWNPVDVHEAPNFVAEPSWSTDGSRVIYGYRFAGVPELNTLFSLKPELENAVTNPSTALTEITSFGTGVPGGRRAAFQPAMLAGGGEVLPAPENFVITPGQDGQPWSFTATLDSDAPGLFLRIQSTLTPDIEGSWTDLPGGGQMTRDGSFWSWQTAVIPAGTRYFRVIAAATGLQDSKTVEPQSYDVISTAGRILYTRGSVLNRELVLMEADGSGKTVLVSGGVFNVQQCALSADGGHAAFTTLAGKLFVMKAEPLDNVTNQPVDILEAATVQPMFGSGITWSPFGPHLAFVGTDSRIYVIEVLDDGGNIHPFNGTSVPLVDVGGTLSGAPNPAWSPDGRHLALLGANHIELLEVADVAGSITTGGATNLPLPLTLQSDSTSSKTHAAWSPDGQTLAFVERAISGNQAKISLLTAFDVFGTLTPESAENPREPLHTMTGAPLVKTVSWSPDGALLALETENGGQHRVELIRPAELDGSNPRIALTSQAVDGDAFQPAFQQPVSDRALPNLVVFQAPLQAGNEGDDPVIVRVVRTGSTATELEVDFAVTGGTADEGLDFTVSESPLVFAEGQTEAHILVTPLADGLDDEGDETVEIELLSVSSGEIGALSKTVVVINDADSNQQPFTPAAAELAMAVNGKVLKKGNAKTGDRFAFTVRQDAGALLPGLEVKIQTSATPNDPSSWTNITGMTLKRATNTSLTWKGSVSATALPQGTVFFRTRSYAAGHRSNAGPVAGAFKITPAPVLVLTTSVVTDSHPDGLTVKPGEFITYHLRCDNIGAAPAKKVVLNSLIPAQTRLDSASHDSGSFPGYFKRILGTRGTSKGVVTDVQWNVGDIQAGQHASEFVTVQVNQEVEFARVIQNDRVTYKGTGLKEIFTPILRTQIESPLLLTLTRDKNIVQAGDLITYTLTAKNDASYQITGGQVRSQTPEGTRLYSANQGDGAGNYLGTELAHTLLEESPLSMTRPGYTLHNRTLLWNIGTLAGGSQRQLRYTVRVAYDLFEKIARNGESFNTEIRNVNFDFTGTPPGGGVIAAYNGAIPSDRITRNPVSAETPAQRPELGLVKKAVSDTVATVGGKEAAAVLADEWRRVTYKIEAWNYGNITAEDTVIYDVLPLGTDFDMDMSLTGSHADDILTTDEPHGFTAGEKIIFTALTGGKGLAVNKIYFVSSVPSDFEFTVSATAGGPVLNFSTDVTVGDARRLAYDWPRFMSRFTLDGAPFAFPDGFKFFDETGAVILPGGEAYVDTNGNGKVDKGEFIDGNGNGKYDGPEKVRSFEFRLGHLAQMTRPAVRTLTYRVKVRPTVKSGTQITAFGSSSVKRGEGLELVSPDFIYPLSGTPELLHTRVVSRMTWQMEPPHPLDAGYVTDDALLRAVPHLIRFKNTSSDLYALDAKLRIPVPQGFEITAPGGSLQKFDAKLDAKLDKSPGTFVMDIGEVAPGQQIERQITCRFLPPMPAGWTDKKGVLLQTQAFNHASVVSTRVSSEPPSSGFNLLSTGASEPRFEIKFDARAASVSALPVMKTNADPRVFVGRIAPAAVQAGKEMDVFIFYGNHGGVRTDNGEIAMQIPWGTRLVAAEPINFNPAFDDPNLTVAFSRGWFTIKTEKGPKRRPQDGDAGVVFFKFGNMAPAEVGVVRVRLFITQDFPMGFVTDPSLYIKFDGVAGKSPPPLSVQVLRNTSGATDWWQAASNFFDKLGNEINAALRNLFGAGNGEFRYDRSIVTLGGADFVHLANGPIIIPLGNSRSAIIAEYDDLLGRMPASSLMLTGEAGVRTGYMAMAAGTTSAQQLFVPGSIQQDRSVQNILAELTSPSSIVAGGGGNIVAAGGGNIVAGGGGNIVAGGGGNVVANDGAGFLPGGITFSIPGVNPGIVAAGGGNIVAAGGGNIVAAGGGNIVAAGGGNIVAAGGGNLIGMDGLKYDISKMSALIGKLSLIDPAKLLDPANVKLIGQDGAGVVANDGAGLIGQDGAGLVGQDGAGFSQ